MPRSKAINPKTQINVYLRQDILTRMYAHLHSDVEGKIPYGQVSEFVESCIREFFSKLPPQKGT